MKNIILRDFLTILTLTCFLYPSISYSEDYVFERLWPSEILGLRSPNGVAVDSSGNVYVVDPDANKMIKFNSSGSVLLTIGGYGSGNGQFYSPSGVAVDSLGNVYVADINNNNRIQKFDSNGTYITQWGTGGSGNGQFYEPSGVAVDSLGNVYVADSGNNRIQKFNSNGTYITQWGTRGTGNGQFNFPSGTHLFNFFNGVAVDSLGNVYVADSGNNRIQKFDSNGTYITQWGTPGHPGDGNGQFYRPTGVAVDSLGNVYVADINNSRIQKFNSNGTYITQWGTRSTDNGQFYRPTGVAVDSLGNVYVADNYNDRIQKFDSNGTYTTKRGTQGSGNGQFNFPFGVAVDSLGNVYVADSNRIQKFDSNGTYITQWGTGGSGNGQFYEPSGVAVDSLGNVYVADSGHNRIQKFDSNGTYITQWGTAGTGNGQFNFPPRNRQSNFLNGVAVDSLGNVYVADTNNSRIQKFNSNGTYITQWGTGGSGNGQFQYPSGVTVDSSGNVYVADTRNHRIQKFDSNGTYITQWGTEGSGNGQFYCPNGVAVSTTGKVYVADTHNNRIQEFSLVNAPPCIKGDVNGDGSVKSNDAILALRISAGLITPTPEQQCAADMNGDGSVRSNDAILILRKVAGLGAPLKNIISKAVNLVTVALDEIHGLSGQSIMVPVKIDNTDMAAGGDICITYDSSVLRAVSAESEHDVLIASNVSEPGKVKIAFATTDKLNSKTLANIKFDILTDKVSPLILQSVELYSHDATPINSGKVNGRFSSWAMRPERSALLQNFPNPFNPDTWIPYQIKDGSDVKIWIYNVSGELVRKLELGYKPAGLYTSRDRSAYWDGKDESGVKVASGIYFYRIQAKGFSEVKKMIVLK